MLMVGISIVTEVGFHSGAGEIQYTLFKTGYILILILRDF